MHRFGSQIIKRSVILGTLLFFLGAGLWGCNDGPTRVSKPSSPRFQPTQTRKVTEVSPPEIFQALRRDLDSYQPQVSILSPRNGAVIDDDQVTVQLQVRDLPVFRDEDLGLGPYLQVYLDDQPYQAVYDANQTLIFQGLMPGTHTIRAIAARPWHETYKNEGAFAEVVFHSFTKTPKNNPDPSRPLLTYSRPQSTVGAEPVMLDFYLTNAPLHLIAQESSEDEIKDWRIRCTVNGESFVFDEWRPIYLKGLKPGKNWIQLELLDEDGLPTDNAFNNTARLIVYEPGGTDSLSRLVRGEVPVNEALAITDPNYVPAPPEPEIAPPEEEVVPTPKPSPDASVEESQPGQETVLEESQTSESEEAEEESGDIPAEITPIPAPAEEPEDTEATSSIDDIYDTEIPSDEDLEEKAIEQQVEPEDEPESEIEQVSPSPVFVEPEEPAAEEPPPVEQPQETEPTPEPPIEEELPAETLPEETKEPAVEESPAADEDVPEVLVAPSNSEPAPEMSPEVKAPVTAERQKPVQKLQDRFQRMRSRIQETLKERTKGANPSPKPSVEATPEAQQPMLPPPDITPELLPIEPEPVVPSEPGEVPPVAPAPTKLPPVGGSPWI